MGQIFALFLGPVMLIGVCYWLAGAPTVPKPVVSAQTGITVSAEIERPTVPANLQNACELCAANLQQRLGVDCQAIVRAPFVLAGDIPTDVLDDQYRETVMPVVRALSYSYFDAELDAPISLVFCSNEQRFHEWAGELDGRAAAEYHGYFQRSDRRAMINAATGSGTLAHELTHALAQFDFPEMPVWFDEGLASLHEQSEFSDDELRLVGLQNWRVYYLAEALANDRLQPLSALLTSPLNRDEQQAIDYAQARYLCLYLQERGLLAAYYRKLRGAVTRDAYGVATFEKLLDSPIGQIDRDFRRWVVEYSRANAETAAAH